MCQGIGHPLQISGGVLLRIGLEDSGDAAHGLLNESTDGGYELGHHELVGVGVAGDVGGTRSVGDRFKNMVHVGQDQQLIVCIGLVQSVGVADLYLHVLSALYDQCRAGNGFDEGCGIEFHPTDEVVLYGGSKQRKQGEGWFFDPVTVCERIEAIVGGGF